MSWKLKSESDLEKVWAQVVRGQETGRYRYTYFDDRPAVEVGPLGLEGRKHKARNPSTVRVAVVAAALGTALAADLVLTIIGSALIIWAWRLGD